MNMQDFYTGHAFDAYEFFGAHTYFGGTHFAVWAPSAQHIAVETEVGTYDMHRTQSAVWECDVPGANAGMVYQYWVRGANGQTVAHCDPYGTAMTLRPDGRSIIADRPTGFTDDKWMAGRTKCFDKPLNIYEVHAGSWRQKEDGSWYTYAELAELLPAYCKENGFTHIELMPLAEHPFDGSWGYQITGFYAPTSRYGTPQQLAEEAVSSELGVIEDNSGNAMYTGFGKDGNPFYVCFFSYKSGAGDHRVAADIASFMNGYADPRRASYFNESAFAASGYAGLRNGIQIPDDERINNFSRYNVTASTSLMWMNASEVAFLRAEGALRGWAMGGDARSFYEEGIRLSFERCGVADQLTAYMASTALPGSYEDPAFGYSCSNQSTVTIPWNDGAAFEENLERIITQKWIANFPLGTEAWADYRRTGYPRLFPVVVNNNPDITNLQLGARRMTYPLEEYEANGETIRAAVDQWLGGQDKMSTRLWWDCNPRIR